MKKIFILIIKIYQVVFSASFGFGKCRFIPTCSCYAILALEKKGLIYGGYLALKRICRCHPFYKKNHMIVNVYQVYLVVICLIFNLAIKIKDQNYFI